MSTNDETVDETEVERIINTLKEDKKIINRMKMENEQLKTINQELRDKLSEVVKDIKDLKGKEEEHTYRFDKGWKDKNDLRAERISEVKPGDIEGQIEEISKIVREMKND